MKDTLMIQKVDFKKSMKELFAPKTSPALVEVPEINYLMINGEGEPNNNPAFQEALQALYNVSYTLKFGFKKGERPADYVDYTVPPLEALWWMADGKSFDMARPAEWRWTAMIMQPSFIRKAHVDAALKTARAKGENLAALEQLRFETLYEGLCVQVMHIGPYDAEAPSLEKMYRFAGENGYKPDGKHHEIYLGDPHKTAPDKLKTVLRQPVSKK